MSVSVHARLGGGGSLLDRPEIKQSGWSEDRDINMSEIGPLLDTGRGNNDRQKAPPTGGGNYRIILLNSPTHTEKAVVRAITSVVPRTDAEHAKNVYATSVSLGMAVIISVLKEHAEHYAQQLYRLGCKTAIEPDTSTS